MQLIQLDRKISGRPVQFRWSAIFAGTFATLGFGLFFILFGNAIGLSAHHVVTGSGGLKFWSWLYTAVAIISAYYAGSYVGTRSSDVTNATMGAFHGVVCWGLASFLAALSIEGASFAANRLLEGTGSNSGNWLAICVITAGFFASVAGGRVGKSVMRVRHEDDDQRMDIAG